MKHVLRVGAAATALVALVVVLGPATARVPAERRPDIVFIVADTLRRDHVGAYADAQANTPFLDSLAARSVVFDRAYSQAPWTAPSVASMFTSRYQSQLRIIRFADLLAEEEQTLAEVLQEAGYATGAFVGNLFLDRGRGYGQGFDEFKMLGSILPGASPKGSAVTINQHALRWLDRLGAGRPPVFLYLHYMEPHIPYELPRDLLEAEFQGGSVPDVAAVNDALLARPDALTNQETDQAKSLYKVAVAHLDRELGRLFAQLERRGIADDAVVVFTADHGESMCEHGWWGHGMSLFEPEIRVPLLVQLPGSTSRQDVSRNVGLIDVAPTILEAAGLASPESFEGRSLMRTSRGDAGLLRRVFGVFGWLGWEDGPVVASENLPSTRWRPIPHERAIVRGPQKMIAKSEGRLAFFDLDSDPGESTPVRLRDGIPTSMQHALADFVRSVETAPEEPGSKTLDGKTQEHLRALGYVE